MKQGRRFLVLTVSVVGISLVSLCLGKYNLGLGETLSFLARTCIGLGSPDLPREELLDNILLQIRLPRVFAALLIGGSLSVVGAVLQAVFTNPLASPKTTGMLAGASFGTVLGVLLSNQWIVSQAFALVFGFCAVGLAVLIARMARSESILMLVLGGIASDALFMALSMTGQYLADPYTKLPAIVHWLMGNLAMVQRSTVLTAAIPMVLGTGLLCLLGRQLNALSMGEDESRALGVPVRFVRLSVLFVSTMLTSLTVLLGGGSMAGWVGLIVPHVARLLIGPNNVTLLPASALIGAGYMVVMDDISRLVFSFELPIGIITSLVGIPFFIYVLKDARKGWA
jgi:iron complex transport system permease protein